MITKKEARVLISEIQHCKDNGMSDDFIEGYVVKEFRRLVKNCYIPAVVGQSEQLPNMTLEQSIEKAKPNLDKITDVDKHLDDIR